ncbi:ankyrin repeat-containing domain protein [Zopfochytrium polystomum]|nr:ankyrin repeat-containing domain protein [Zopfochytrium polystomum]
MLGRLEPTAATEGLLLAADSGRLDLAKFFLGCGAMIEGTNHGLRLSELYSKPLHRACRSGNLEMVRLLVQQGASLNSQALWGMSSLHIACVSGRVDVVEYLAMNGADIHATTNDGRSPFMVACAKGNVNVARTLLKLGAKVASSEFNGLLSAAARSASLETVQFLFQRCIASDSSMGYSATKIALNNALYYAAKCGNLDIAQWLNSYVDVNDRRAFRTEEVICPLEAACEGDHLDIMDFLLDQGWERSKSDDLLRAAAIWGSVEIVELLLSRESLHCICGGAEVNHAMREVNGGNIVVQCAALLFAVRNGNIGVVQVLLDYGAWVDSKDDDGRTALHNACDYGRAGIAQVLLMAGADINARTLTNLTPMDYAIVKEHEDVVEVLRSWEAEKKGQIKVN